MDQLNCRSDDVLVTPNTSSQPIPDINGSNSSQQLVGAQSVSISTEQVKRKRGRPPRAAQMNLPVAKKIKEDEEEDVCFICFDGGSLVLCDRRGCPKAYHPACIKRDDAFFQSKAKWNCGWHICSMCEKAAHHMCYTCTYSLCKRCIRHADYVCVRGDKGFCTICMKTIMLIENNVQGKEEMAQVDFDDKTSWEYLFKVYWVYLKDKLSLTVDELTQAKNPWKVAVTIGRECISPDVQTGVIDLKNLPNGPSDLSSLQNGANDLQSLQNGADDIKSIQYEANAPENLSLDLSAENLEANDTKRRKTDEQLKLLHEATLILERPCRESGTPLVGSEGWATKELLEFVAHMKNGDTSALSQFDVQALLLEYVKKNNLRDPRRKSQILCDSRLYNLFGKPCVGHFEMLKLLEYHFPIKEDPQKNIVGSVARQVDPDWNSDSMLMLDKDKKRKPRRNGEERAPQANLDEYAAIDAHNINLIYLRRGLMENLLEDSEKFHLKVVGSVVRIRISSSDQKQDMYRLVQVVGTNKADQPYKIGDRTTDVVLEVLNLNKKETVLADTISNQEFSEDECRRLRQSIRCGLVKQFTVGEILEKAVALQSVRLNDWLETEIQRLNHLRDRASEKGRKKELRECVEKIQLLKTPEERQRRLDEIPEVHADPKMNPECESEEDAADLNNNKRGEYMKTRYSEKRGKVGKSSSPHKRSEGSNETGIRPDNIVKAQTTQQNEVASETSASILTMGNTLSTNEVEADKLWHYRDPNGRVQGPFTMVQLQKWSTTGYFPIDMRIWANKQEDSILLTDALKGEFRKAVQVGGVSDSKSFDHDVQHSEKNNSQRVRYQIDPTHGFSSLPASTTLSFSNVGNNENQSKSRPLSGQSSGQNWNTLPSVLGLNNSNSNLNSAVSSVTKSTYVIETNGAVVLSNLHSPTPKASDDHWGGQKEGNVSSVRPVKDSEILDLPSPTPKISNKSDTVLDNRENQSVPSKLVVQESVPSWSTASKLVVGGAQLPEIVNELGGYSLCPTKPLSGEWNPSMKLPEAKDELVVDTSTANIDHLIHSSTSQPPATTMSWQGIVSEPIEFSTLAEESVSDLLAEVDAMESQCGFSSPTSKRNFVDDLFNGSIDDFSPTPDQGARSDGFSSSGDMHLPCQSTTPEELGGPTHGIVFDFLKRSEVDGDSKSSVVPVSHGTYDAPRTNSEAILASLTGVKKEKDVLGNERVSNNAEVAGGPQHTDVRAVQEEDAKPIDHANLVDPNNDRKAKSGVAVRWNNTTSQHSGQGSETAPEAAKWVQDERERKPINMSITIPECTVRAEKEGEIAISSDFVEPNVAAKYKAKVTDTARNSPTISHTKNDGTVRETVNRAEAQPPNTRREHADQSNSQKPGSGYGRQSHGTTNTGRGNGNTSGRGSVGAADSPRRYSGERYSGGSRDRPHNPSGEPGSNRGRTSWNRQSYGAGGGGGGGAYAKPSPKGQRVCKFYESGRCKKGALCDYLHP